MYQRGFLNITMQSYVDVEATSKFPSIAHILEAGAIVLDERGNEIASFETFVNPGRQALAEADPEAARVNGITADMLKGAPGPEEAARLLSDFLDRFPAAPLHAFNNGYDRTLLTKQPWRLDLRPWGECVMQAAMAVMGEAGVLVQFPNGGFKWPRLSEAARFFGIQIRESHRALADARTTARIHAALRKYAEANELNEDEVQHLLEDGL